MFSPLSGILRRFSRTFRQITEDIVEKILSALHKGSDIKAIVEHIWQTKGAAESIREAVKATIRESYEKGAHKTLKVFPAHLDAAWDESGMKLSEKLHGADAEMRAAIVKTIREQLRQNQHALKAARALYDGYGNGQAVIRRQHIPKYLQDVVDFARRSDLTEADRAELLKKVRRARRQVERLGQGGAPNQALKTAYRELLDAVTDGTEEALTRSVHTAIEEKSRYVAERIARTESARAWADGFAEKYMDDDTVVAFRWKLSSRHPVFDICNLYAEADLYGLGKGIFPKDQTPRLPVHPHCLCHLAPVYRSELNKIAHNLVKSGGEKYINVLSLERRQKLLGVAGSKRYQQGVDWRTLARNYSPEVMQKRSIPKLSDITNEFVRRAKPGTGKITYDEGYRKSRHREEIRVAEWLHSTFGGDIQMLNEKTRFKTKSPDYIWNGKMWDLKTLQTVTAIDSALRHGVKQIENNPGGILLNFSDIDLDLSDIAPLILNRLRRSASSDMDVMILQTLILKNVFHFKAKINKRP